MKLTVVQSASNNSSWKLVRSSNHSIRCHPRSSSFPSKNLHVVSSKISTRRGVEHVARWAKRGTRGKLGINKKDNGVRRYRNGLIF